LVKKRLAFTLIELIIAIVVIAVTVMSLPMLSNVIGEGISANIVQEAVFASASELNEATTAHWDKNSFDSGSSYLFAKVIDIDNDCNTTTKLRPGHIQQPYHRQCLNDLSISPSDTKDTTDDIVTIDDMAHDYTDIFINATTSQSGYKDSYKSKLQVVRPANFNGSNQNIKEIISTIKNSKNQVIVSLKTYSANIGEVDYFKRKY
jgi:prepilin-type N-terminal cleavage/methylation domain-containing protein